MDFGGNLGAANDFLISLHVVNVTIFLRPLIGTFVEGTDSVYKEKMDVF